MKTVSGAAEPQRSDATRAYSAEYGGALADHLPMALSALARMGAGEPRRANFARTYAAAKMLRPLGTGEPETLARARVRERIARDGREKVVRDELAELAAGLGAGAFHAFIRVAYALADGDDDDLAAGLTYWRHAALDLGEPPRCAREVEPFDATVALERARRVLEGVPASLDRTALIAQRMAAVARDAAFADAVGAPNFGVDAIARIAALTVRAFAATRSFTLLHAMTATHALRIVAPFAADPDTLFAYFWRAYVAAYVSAGAPVLPADADFDSERASAPAWETLVRRACDSDDEHEIKATFTAWSEDAVYRDATYRVAAARYLRIA